LQGEFPRAASATVSLNGVQILAPTEPGPDVPLVAKPVASFVRLVLRGVHPHVERPAAALLGVLREREVDRLQVQPVPV